MPADITAICLVWAGGFNAVNLNLYHYAGNNPIRYTDPDGRDVNKLYMKGNSYFFDTQNSGTNSRVLFGTEPNGRFNPEGELIQPNTIGGYGCKFICAVNIGNTLRQENCKKHLPSCGVVPYASPAEFAKKDKYFSIVDGTTYSNGDYETDANMTNEQMAAVISDMSGISIDKIHITEISGTENIIKTLKSIRYNKNKNAFIVGFYKSNPNPVGHFFHVLGLNTEKNYTYDYIDVELKRSAEKEQQMKNAINSGKMSKILVIEVY